MYAAFTEKEFHYVVVGLGLLASAAYNGKNNGTRNPEVGEEVQILLDKLWKG